MPQRNVASNFTFEQQRVEINDLAGDFWTQKGVTDTAAGTYLLKDGSNAFTGATLGVPNAFTINSNSGAGTVTINANLQVQGTTTTLNSTTLEIADKNIVLAKGSANDAAADGAGLTVDSTTDKTFNFVDADDAFVSSIGLKAIGGFTGNLTGNLTGDVTGTASGNATVANNSDNRVITGGNGTALNGEANLTYDGTSLEVKTGSFKIWGTEGNDAEIRLFADEGDDNADAWSILSTASDNTLKFRNATSGSYVDKLIIDKNGAVGIGVTPEIFHSNNKGVIRGNGGYTIVGRSDNFLGIGQNFYYDSSDAGKYIATGEASLYSQTDGVHKFFTAASGTAGASASLVENLCITATGNTKFWGTRNGSLQASDSDNLQIYTKSANADGDRGSGITFYNHDNSGYEMGGTIQVAKENDTADNTSSYMRFGTRFNGNDVVERLRIDSNGYVGIKVANPHVYYAKDLVLGCIDQGGITLKAAATDDTQYLMFADGTSGNEAYRGYIGYQHDTGTGIGEHLQLAAGGTASVTLDANGKLAVNGDVHDSKGNLRTLPQNSQSGGYNLVAADAGKHINTTGDVGVYTGQFVIGDAVTIFNKGTADIAISLGGGVTMYQAGTTNVGNRMLAAKGICTILCTEQGSGTNTFVISGAGLT